MKVLELDSLIQLDKPLILASKSPRRVQLLKQIGMDFQVIVSDVVETLENNRPPKEQAIELSLAKAQDVAKQVDNGLIIGADTIVILYEKILGKPIDFNDAFSMLKYLSGQTHQVYTGFTIVDSTTANYISDCECTNVTFRSLTDQEIETYIHLDSPFDKAGSYGIQDRSALFVEKIDGCYYNVVGFPLTKFYLRLIDFVNM